MHLSTPPPAVERLLGNIVYDPCAPSLGKAEKPPGQGHGFVMPQTVGEGQIRVEEYQASERRKVGAI